MFILVSVICTMCRFTPVSACLGRLLPTDISHQIICYGSVSRSDQFLTKRCHHVSQVYTLFLGLENSQCLGPPKVHKSWGASEHYSDNFRTPDCGTLTVEIVQVSHSEKSWQSAKWFFTFCLCTSDCDSARFEASSYAALHRGRPPERPLNCKKTLHLGTSNLTPYPAVRLV